MLCIEVYCRPRRPSTLTPGPILLSASCRRRESLDCATIPRVVNSSQMGTLRFLIALLVIATHAPHIGWPYTPASIPHGEDPVYWGGLHPLHSFFILAGFYAFLSLRTKIGSGLSALWDYYRSRFVRLYPVFAATAALTLAVSYLFPVWGPGYNPRWGLENVSPLLSAPSKLLLWAPNFMLVGSDVPAWFNLLDASRLEIAGQTWEAGAEERPAENIWLLRTSLNPPTFAMGMMLWFFLLAPFLVAAGWRTVVATLVASYALLQVFGSKFIFDGYFIWIFWLWLFCCGMLSSMVFTRWGGLLSGTTSSSPARRTLTLIFGCSLIVWVLSSGVNISTEVFALVFSLTLPPLAMVTKSSRLDQYLGNLSYPLYCFMHLGLFLSVILVSYGVIENSSRMYSVLAMGLIYAVLLERFLERPLTALRHIAPRPTPQS